MAKNPYCVTFNIVAQHHVAFYKRENTLIANVKSLSNPSLREDFSEYVAHLQLHMALQSRNLVPPLTQTADSREQLLHQTQADFEKFISRQAP